MAAAGFRRISWKQRLRVRSKKFKNAWQNAYALMRRAKARTAVVRRGIGATACWAVRNYHIIFFCARGIVICKNDTMAVRRPKPTFGEPDDNDRGSKFHIKREAGFQPIYKFIDCKDVHQVFMEGEVQKYMHHIIIIVMKEMFHWMRSWFNILM